MESIIVNNSSFNLIEVKKEEELEKIVFKNRNYVFGENVLLFPKKAMETNSNRKVIPDGFLIDLSIPKFFIVEIELSIHGLEHIEPQIRKFRSSFKNEKTKRVITDKIYSSLKDRDRKLISEKTCESEIYKFIHKVIFENDYGIIIVIDKKNMEMIDWKEQYPTDLQIIEFNIYRSGEGFHEILWKHIVFWW